MLTHPAWSLPGPRVVPAPTEPASPFPCALRGGTLQHPGSAWVQGLWGCLSTDAFWEMPWAVPPRGRSNPAVPPSSSEQLSLGVMQKMLSWSLGCPGCFGPPCCWFLPGHGCRTCMPSGGLQIACGVAADCESLPCSGAGAQGELSWLPPYRRAGQMCLTLRGPCRSGGGEAELWSLGEAFRLQLLAQEPRASEDLSKGYKHSPVCPMMASGPSQASPALAPLPAAWLCWWEVTLCRGLFILKEV